MCLLLSIPALPRFMHKLTTVLCLEHYQVEEVFAAHQDVLTEARYRDSALQSIRANLKWLSANGGAVCAWLAAPVPDLAHAPSLAPAPAPGPAFHGAPLAHSPQRCLISALLSECVFVARGARCM